MNLLTGLFTTTQDLIRKIQLQLTIESTLNIFIFNRISSNLLFTDTNEGVHPGIYVDIYIYIDI